jgi:hypothetical protein
VKSLNSRALVLAFISSLALVCALQAGAQANTTPAPVKVVNTTKNPVPTVAQGTTKISGNVNVTNSSLPVNGSVSITNSSVPVNVTNTPLGVSGTVAVSNLPLDANGNVLVSIAPDTTQYQYLSLVAFPCSLAGVSDFCYFNGTTTLPIEQSLTTYSSQGYALFSVTPCDNYASLGGASVYTLRAPVTGARKKASPVR